MPRYGGFTTDGEEPSVKRQGSDLGIKVPSGSDSLGFSVLSESTCYAYCVPGPS